MRTTHSMSYSGRVPGGDPPTSKELWRQDILRMRSSCLEFATSWECGRETLSLSIHDKANERTPEKESGRRGPRYGASRRPQKTRLFPCWPAHFLHPSTTPMEQTMTTMIEGFMTRLDARRNGEPCQEANSEMAEASYDT